MSMRSNSSHGRGSGRGRSRGRGNAAVWQGVYHPGPEVYQQLYHVRREPAIVTPRPPSDCPIPHATSRILGRQTDEGPIRRIFYKVEVVRTRHDAPSSKSDKSIPARSSHQVEIFEVDLSRVLDFVSAEELENYENEQFRLEAEAEAVVLRAKAQERARRWREKNVRAQVISKDSHMPSECGMFSITPTRGGPRGRGRGKGRGRGGQRGRPSMLISSALGGHNSQDELMDDSIESPHRQEIDLQRIIAETESEEEDELDEDTVAHASSDVMHSAFVTNSALPVSPARPRTLPTPLVFRGETGQYTVEETSPESKDLPHVASSPVEPYEDVSGIVVRDDEEPPYRYDDDFYNQALLFRNQSSLPDADSSLPDAPSVSSDDSISAEAPFISRVIEETQTANGYDKDVIQILPHSSLEHQPLFDDDVELDIDVVDVDVDAEEYVIESILEHYYDSQGKKFYLVKWEGYEDSHDWLSEADLESAQELLAEYNGRIKKENKKVKARMFPSQK